ncbi:hypothetical protein ACFQ1S_43985, partial [Kibdelosporangium lantanae]
MDEAIDPDALVTDLLVPLVESQVCRVVVGVRSEDLAGGLAPLGRVMDLNKVNLDTLRDDLETYANALLRRMPSYGSREYLAGRAHLAASMAAALTGPERSVWGEYLTIRLYVQTLGEPIKDVLQAEQTGQAIPLDPAGLRLPDNSPWFRPVLSAVEGLKV